MDGSGLKSFGTYCEFVTLSALIYFIDRHIQNEIRRGTAKVRKRYF